MNEIARRQNEKQMLAVAWERRRVYDRVKVVQGILVIVSLFMPVLGVIVAIWAQSLKPYVALASLIVGCTDAAFVDRWIKRQMKEGARLQEHFDCSVLELPWNRFLSGSPIDAEDIAAYRQTCPPGDGGAMRDWYAPSVSRLPVPAARLACQRSNLRYDLRLRRRYCTIVTIAMVVVVVAAFAIAVVQNPSMSSFVLSGAVPVMPLVLWGVRERNRQLDASALVERLKAHVEKLWESVLAGEGDNVLTMSSRELQDAIFSHRVSSPLVFNWLYSRLRSGLEQQMAGGVEHSVDEFRASASQRKTQHLPDAS
ncbi:hypothetical protein G3N58_31200 [Paraburkholderia sp. Ac-20342]|uniref:S-4TM family putative pore-forming effector n=1 Tax=unclassified Paraburkholderia TaxID=2615204 RepID=UPI00141EB25C|nr:hypothetical protein [Paraburkholderia sp. Ac-20342]NIF80797.1 hypothetical protein [Paraburkholderia sp. Cy-641]